MGKLLAWIVLPIVALIAAGMVAWWLIGQLFSVFGYLLLGAAVVGAGFYLYTRVRRGLGSTRTQNRIAAAKATYRAGRD